MPRRLPRAGAPDGARGVSQDIGMAWPARSGDVEGTPCHYRCCHRGPLAGRGSAGLWGFPGLGQPAGGPLPGRGRGGVRAAVPAAEDLTRRDRQRHRRADRHAAQGAGGAGPGRRAAHHLLAPAAPSRDRGVGGHGQQAPDPGGAGHPRPGQAPEVVYLRFEAEQPNECWQSDFTHYRLAGGTDTEILCWLDDHSRYVLHLTAHVRVTGPIVLASFGAACEQYGVPASTLTDNGTVYTARFVGGRNGLENELRRLGVKQKNGKPNHPQTQGKAERFQQTLKKWLAAQPCQPATIAQLQVLLDTFTRIYNTKRPHRSLPHRATPATAYAARPKAAPGTGNPASHDRVRADRVDADGKLTLRYNGRLYHIGIGRTHARTRVLMLIHDLDIRIINAATGEILRQLTLNPGRNYQPTGRPPGPPPGTRRTNRNPGP